MLSIPPVMIISLSPSIILCVPNINAFIPDAQTLFTVVHGAVFIIPAPNDACLAGAWPIFACNTFPIITSSISLPERPISSKHACIAIEPSFVADNDESEPWNEPNGVRFAATI